MDNSNIDPVSGNTVPPGALPAEVRDNVDIKASKGEYIVPADVVRFIGLDRLEKMVSQAKDKLVQLHSDGRIGGKGEGDLPFSPQDLVTTDAPQTPPPKMAEGGLVLGFNPQNQPNPSQPMQFNLGDQGVGSLGTDITSLLPDSVQSQKKRGHGNEHTVQQPLTGQAGAVDTWSPEDFYAYTKQIADPGVKLLKGFVSLALPMGRALMKARDAYLQKNVPEKLQTMLDTGKDLQGNPLSEEQLAMLHHVSDTIGAPAVQTPSTPTTNSRSNSGGSNSSASSTPSQPPPASPVSPSPVAPVTSSRPVSRPIIDRTATEDRR